MGVLVREAIVECEFSVCGLGCFMTAQGIFCRIVDGRAGVSEVYEDDQTLALMALTPVRAGVSAAEGGERS